MSIVLEVLRTARALEKAAHTLFQSAGITAAQFNVLNLLHASPEGLSASALASQLIVDPSNVTGLVRRMKAAGWVESIESTVDRRQHIVGLTAKGRRIYLKVAPEYEAALSEMEKVIKRAQRAPLTEQLLLLREAADAYDA